MKKDNHPNDAFTENVKTTLDRSVEELDGETLARLDSVRRQAVASADKKRRGKLWYGMAWGSMGSVAMATIVAAVWLLNPVAPKDITGSNLPEMAIFIDDELTLEGKLLAEAMSDEDIELLEEIEFVAWLMEQEDINAG